MAAEYPYVAIKPKGIPPQTELPYSSDQQRKIDKKIQSMRQHVGLYRMCRLFLNVSFEGVRIDNVAIVDEINFDCYESIVEGVQTALAHLQDRSMPPEGVHIEGLWYYKKRARGRMTAVPLLETTDGFRAIAEHPSGEVYLGVRFTQIMAAVPIRDKHQAATTGKSKRTNLTVTNNSPEVGLESLPENNTDIENVAVPISTCVQDGQNITIKMDTDVMVEPDTISVSLTEERTNDKPVRNNDTPLHQVEEEEEVKPKFIRDTIWPLDTTIEIVVKSSGMEEKRTIHPDFYPILYQMTKIDYAGIAKEVLDHQAIHSHLSMLSWFGKKGTGNPPVSKDACTDTSSLITKDMKSGKEEVFRLMSQMALSKVDFKKLLSWTKSLRLLPGKSGKYFLTERNILGRTKVEDSQPHHMNSEKLLTPSSSLMMSRDIVTRKNNQKTTGPLHLIPFETMEGDKKKTLYLPASGPPIADQQGTLFIPIPPNYLPLIQQSRKQNVFTNQRLVTQVEDNTNRQSVSPFITPQETDSPMSDQPVPTGVFKVSRSEESDPFLQHLRTAGFNVDNSNLNPAEEHSDSDYYPSDADINDTDTSNPSEYADTTDFEGSQNESDFVNNIRRRRKTAKFVALEHSEDNRSDDSKTVDELSEVCSIEKDKDSSNKVVKTNDSSKEECKKADRRVRKRKLDDVLRIKIIKQESQEKNTSKTATNLSKQVLRVRKRKKDKPVRKNSPAPKESIEKESFCSSAGIVLENSELIVVKTEPADEYE